MYKLGDKVETPLGIGKLVDISANNETKYKVMYGTKSTWYAHDEISPYRTAHEKLIEMGYEEKIHDTFIMRHVESGRYKQYVKGSEFILIDVKDREFTTYTLYSGDEGVSDISWVSHKLSHILTQYLEELEK